MKGNAEVLNEVMAKWKMKINWEKTNCKVLVVQRGGGTTCHIVVNGVEVDEVKTAKYFGVIFNTVRPHLSTPIPSPSESFPAETNLYTTFLSLLTRNLTIRIRTRFLYTIVYQSVYYSLS